jgi:hypothetical protein
MVKSFTDYLAERGPELLGILASTWLGAAAAFRFERWMRRREKTADDRRDGERAQLVLIDQYEFIKQLECLHLRPLREDPLRWLNLNATVSLATPQRLDRSTLDYLLDTHPGLLNQLNTHDRIIVQAVGLFKERGEAHERLGARLVELDHTETSAPNLDTPAGRDLFEQKLGVQIVEPLKGLTDSLYASVDHALKTTHVNYTQLTEALAGHFPGARLLPMNALQQIDEGWGDRASVPTAPATTPAQTPPATRSAPPEMPPRDFRG